MIFVKEQAILKIIKIGVYAVPLCRLWSSRCFFFPFATSRGFLLQIFVEIIVALYVVLALKTPAYQPQKDSALFLALSLFFNIAPFLFLGLDPYRSFSGITSACKVPFARAFLFVFQKLVGIRQKEEWTKLIKTSSRRRPLVAFGIN